MDLGNLGTVPQDLVRSGPIELPEASMSATASMKRRASEAFENTPDEEASHKKLKENNDKVTGNPGDVRATGVDGNALADTLDDELQCGCCSAIVYRPVVVAPCQHFFCGSCVTLWIRNGGTSCPACRTVSTSVSYSRPLQKVLDTLLRHAPGKARSVSERMQADAIYHPGVHLRIPSPRQASPEPNLPSGNGLYVRPCPHCLPGNQWGWRCPQPIVDPDVDPNHAWPVEDGNPPGHGICGNCENVLALRAPTTTRCDFCQVSFCGIGIPHRCITAPIIHQQPHGLVDLGDLIQCGEIYDCFEGNTVEVDIMLDYLSAQGLTPKNIYREIATHIQSLPRQFAPLIELELFMDIHPVASGIDPDPSAPRTKICRICATEVLLYGLRDWWVRERKKGFLDEHVMARPDCPDGSQCQRQKNHAHAKEFNHIIAPPDPHPALEPASHPPAQREREVRSVTDFGSLISRIPMDPLEGPSRAGAARVPVPLPPLGDIIPLLPVPSRGDQPLPFVNPDLSIASASDLTGYVSAPSSQDFRDEVDALL